MAISLRRIVAVLALARFVAGVRGVAGVRLMRAPPGPARCRTADPGRVRGPGSDPGWAHVQPSTSAWLSSNAAAPFSPCSRVKSLAGTSSSSRKGSPASRSAVRYPSTRKWLGSTGLCRPPLARRRRAGVLDEDRVAPALCRQERRLDKHGEVRVRSCHDGRQGSSRRSYAAGRICARHTRSTSTVSASVLRAGPDGFRAWPTGAHLFTRGSSCRLCRCGAGPTSGFPLRTCGQGWTR